MGGLPENRSIPYLGPHLILGNLRIVNIFSHRSKLKSTFLPKDVQRSINGMLPKQRYHLFRTPWLELHFGLHIKNVHSRLPRSH